MLSDFLTFGNMERAFNLLYSTGPGTVWYPDY